MTDVRHREEASPSYSWYVRDWRASHRVHQLSWKERGFYRECLDWAWDLDGLPNDLEFIRGRLQATKGDFEKLWPAAKRFFDVATDGRLRNARQEVERRKLHAFLRRSSDGGKATAGGQRKQAAPVGSGGAESGSSPPAAAAASALHLHSPLLVPSRTPSPLPVPVPPTHSGGGGVLAGSLPRDHLRHAECGRVCLHDQQFERFAGKFGGDPETARAAVRSWARAVLAEWDQPPKSTQPIAGNDFQFWDARWIEWHGAAESRAGKQTTRLAQAVANIRREGS